MKLARLQLSAPGRFLLKGDEGYEALRTRIFNQRCASRFPAAIVEASDEEDVVQAVRWANDNNLKVSVRSGGHNWYSSFLRDESLLIDVKNLKATKVNVTEGTAVAGPGCTGEQLNLALEPHGLAFPSGHCDGVPIGGFLLGGGAGLNINTHGPGCVHIQAIDVVSPEGTLLHASETQNSDFLYLARGAGQAMKGVVTAFHVKCCRAVSAASKVKVVFDGADWVAVAEWVRGLMEGGSVPQCAEVTLIYTRPDPFAGPLAIVGITAWADSAVEASEAFQAFSENFPAPLLQPSSEPVPTSFSKSAKQLAGAYPGGYRWTGDAAGFDWDASAEPNWSELWKEIRSAAEAHAFSGHSHILLCFFKRSDAGAEEQVSGALTALPTRLTVNCYGVYNDEAEDAAQDAMVKAVMAPVLRLGARAVMNEGNLLWRDSESLRSMFGERYDEVEKRRRRADPNGVFCDPLTNSDTF